MPKGKRTNLPPVTAEDIAQRPELLRRTGNSWAWKCAHCGKFASSVTQAGKYVCRDHGGTTPAQRDPVAQAQARAAGEKVPRPPGRPITSGLYSRSEKVKVDAVVADYQARGVDPDATEEDMLYLRAHLDVLKAQGPSVEPIVAHLELLARAGADLLRVKLEDGHAWFDTPDPSGKLPPMKVEDALKILALYSQHVDNLKAVTALLRELRLFTVGLEERHTNLIKLAKDRADTRLKNKAAEEISVFAVLVKRLRVSLEDTLPRELYLGLGKRLALDFSEIPARLLEPGTIDAD